MYSKSTKKKSLCDDIEHFTLERVRMLVSTTCLPAPQHISAMLLAASVLSSPHNQLTILIKKTEQANSNGSGW